MSATLHSKEVTTASLRAVSFGFYTDEEIRKISVKRIVNPIMFDNSRAPVEGGLCDPALGPMDFRERCTTCGLSSECPGHFGHIELAAPVYNPLVFTTLYKLLRCTCLHCFKFRMSDKELQRYVLRLHLLLRGDVTGAQGVTVGTTRATKAARDELDALDGPMDTLGDEDGDGEGSPTSVVDGASRRDVPMTGHSLQAAIATIREIFARQPPGHCANCGAWSPAIKREGYSKLFLMPLQVKRAAANRAAGTEVLPNLFRMQRGEEDRGRGVRPAGSDGDSDSGSGSDSDAGKAERKTMRRVKAEAESKGVLAADADRRDLGGVSQAALDEAEAARTEDLSQPKFLTPAEVQEIVRCVWAANPELMALIYPAEAGRRAAVHAEGREVGAAALAAARSAAARSRALAATNYREFFIRTLAVPPNRFRPLNKIGDQLFEHPQNTTLARVINLNLELMRLAREAGSEGADGRMLLAWLAMQNSVNAFIDTTTAEGDQKQIGIRQALEKKEGLFRKNMMGKRVNFAARSVISPDVYLNGGEIGIPPYIAARLTFPERVTPWNVERLCEAVIAGPGKNPGAVAVEDERGRLLTLREDRASREAVARRLFTQIRGATRAEGKRARDAAAPASPRHAAPLSLLDGAGALSEFGGCKVVYRSMEDGDVLLTNRQPTLHKPGLMAHRARIMRDERTIRFHYANCATFNADFDGDEINLHLPQDQLGRAEGYGIVSADRQFFVPTDGKPLRGLIQDHIVSGTLLTMRDRFFTRADYAQLVYDAVCVDCSGAWEVWTEPPALLKPARLWTGKQVLTAVLMHYTRDQLPFSLCTASKVPVDTWGKTSGEGRLRIQHARLVAGVVDKNCFGKHGLVHFFHELYGPERTSLLTAALSRLFTAFLQRFGFTCGMADVYLVDEAERQRAGILRGADARCLDAAAELVSGAPRAAPRVEAGASPEQVFLDEQGAVRRELALKHRASPATTGALLDMKSSSAMHPLSSEVVRACLPAGQSKPFRHNMMALMTVTGAKGSVVNFSQISCLLGQQELEGRRVPRMASGKTLPCFAPFDVGARSGGFVGDRFLTGLRPQEYYFHCMAGREGLVDTTVKTSRSGYIQRCLVKNLEPLRVAYDGTVRDDTDASVVQFRFGEDGVDTTRTGCLRTLPFFFYNMPQLGRAVAAAAAAGAGGEAERARREATEEDADRRLRRWGKDALRGAEDEAAVDAAKSSKSKKKRRKEAQAAAEDVGSANTNTLPPGTTVPPTTLGVASEGFQAALLRTLFGGGLLPASGAEAMAQAYKATLRALQRCRRDGKPWDFAALDPGAFARLMQARFQQCQAAPGEAVGVIAAQSIGEPSTQMTLNTFHMAGRGEANVTLGIPRLREILMTASANIATPVMTLPVRAEHAARGAQELAGRLRRVLLGEALRALEVEENVLARSGVTSGGRARVGTVTLRFHAPEAYPAELGLRWQELEACFRKAFVPKFQTAVRMEMKKASTGNAVASVSVASVGGEEAGAGRAEAPADGAGAEGTGATRDDALEAESEEDEEGKTRFGQGRGEHATYDAGDEEDERLASEARRGDPTLAEEEDEEEEGSDEDAEMNARMEEEEAEREERAAAEAAELRAWQLEGGVRVDEEARTCQLKLHFALDSPKLLLRELAERVVAATVLRGTPGVTKCYVLDARSGGGAPAVQTDGINLAAAARAGDIVDTAGVYANSPAAMLEVYGVEACRASIIREAAAVFGAYGIGVDQRHLSLIADYMTHLGGCRPCNRTGISASTSPFLKVTFETAAAFLISSTLHGDIDRLTSPASRIVVGQPVAMGTGAMGLVQKLEATQA